MHEAKRETQQQLSEAPKELERASAESQRLQEQWKAPVEVDPKSVAELKTRRNLLSVDVAGAEARIVATSKLLGQKDRALSSPVYGQLESMKIAAEIELASLKARQTALDLLINKGTERGELESRLRQVGMERSAKSQAVSNSQKRLSELDELIKRLGPFELYEGKIVIQPIKWDSPATTN